MTTRTIAAGACLTLAIVAAVHGNKNDLEFINPPAANAETPPASGIQPNKLPANFSLLRIAQGSDPLENPSGVVTRFGFLGDGTPTEPDQNTYLVLDRNPGGPTTGYNYGRHFLFQGHENSGDLAYVTRINLDVTDPAHRITLLTPPSSVTGKTSLNSVDGSAWDPFTGTIVFTQEAGASGGVFEIPAQWTSTAPPALRNLSCVLGKAGYEGVHPDARGNLLLQEDTGGANVSVDPTNIAGAVKVAKQPNSFIYRFVPTQPSDLGQGGDLFALQATVDGQPLVFGGDSDAARFADVYSAANRDLRLPGSSWPVRWVQVHHSDPVVNLGSCTAFDANAQAKTAGATPFKRPENGAFVPGTDFNSFVFDETGDTDTRSSNVPELAQRGAWGSLFRVDFADDGPIGTLRILVTGDADHASFDNVSFATDTIALVTEDRGDTLHDQLNKLDSAWAYDISDATGARLIALGRDEVAAPLSKEDNEPTGLHASDGDSSISGLAGTAGLEIKAVHANQIDGKTASVPAGLDRSRWFVTMQHGLNQVFQIFLMK